MRLFNYWHLSLVLLLSLGSHSCAQNKATIDIKEDEKLIEFTTDRFTLPNLHVTPDGKSIIFDVLGDIYKVSIIGGKAEVLLQDNNWKRGAKLSPDGKSLAYVSDETGEFQVWTLDLATKEKKSYPIKEFLHYPLYAYWSYDGRLLIPSSEGLWSFNVNTGDDDLKRKAKEEERSVLHIVNRKMSVNKSGTHAYFQNEGAFWACPINQENDLFISDIAKENRFIFHQVSPSGYSLVNYREAIENTGLLELIYWDLETNQKKLLWTTKALRSGTNLNYSFDFIDDNTIVLDKEGEIVRMDIKTGESTSIPIEVDIKKKIKKPLHKKPQYIKDSIITASVLRNPVTKTDLDTIYFSAFGKLHSYAKESEVITELYPEKDRFEVSPSLSPNGKYLAYTTWNDWEMGHLYVLELVTGQEYQLTQTSGRYINPTWSPTGSEIVFISDETEAKLGVMRQNGGGNTYNYPLELLKIEIENLNKDCKMNKMEFVKRVTPLSIAPRRFNPVPMYHVNGKSIFISTRDKENNLPTLIEINLKSKKVVNEKLIPFHTDEVLIAPNGEHIAFIFDEQIWVDTYPHSTKLEFLSESEFIPSKYYYRGGVIDNILLPNAKAIYEIAPSYLSWQDENTLMWGSADEVHNYDVRTGKSNKIANIKVQRPRAIPEGTYALTNVKIITINKKDEIIEKGTILIKDNRIELVGTATDIDIPLTYKIYDLEGKTIIPGLIDVHAHYHNYPYEIINQQSHQMVGNIAYGVTSFYDPSVNALDYREQAQMVEAGVLLGPRVFASGNIIMQYPTYYDYNNISTKNDAERVIKSINKLNVHGPIKEYDKNNRKERRFLRRASAHNGLSITAHQNSYIQSLARIIDGYSAVEHEIGGFDIQMDAINLIAKSGVHYTPTLTASLSITELYTREILAERTKLSCLNGDLYYKNNFADRKYSLDFSTPSILQKQHSLKRASVILKKIIELGGMISVGGHGDPLPGIGTHTELWSFTYAGLDNYEALKAATINGAKKLDLQEEIGSIEKGKLADMVVLNSDPLENVFNTTDILYTIQNGNIYEAKTMKKIYPIEKKLQPWGWQNIKILDSVMQSIN